jgi:hypothetical protein
MPIAADKEGDSGHHSKSSEIVPVPPPRGNSDIIPEIFFDALKRELTKVLGPMAGFLIKEQLKALGATRTSFPRSQLSKLLASVSVDIFHDRLRAEFQQEMRKVIQSITPTQGGQPPEAERTRVIGDELNRIKLNGMRRIQNWYSGRAG